MSIELIPSLLALILCIIHALGGRAPLWFAVLLLALAMAMVLPSVRPR